MDAKQRLIEFLVNDFLSMFPESNYSTQLDLRVRLSAFTIEELELLKTQCEVPNECEMVRKD